MRVTVAGSLPLGQVTLFFEIRKIVDNIQLTNQNK